MGRREVAIADVPSSPLTDRLLSEGGCMTTEAQPAIDEAKLNAFMMKAVGDMGAAAVCATILLGQDFGLYKALAGAGPVTPAELAKKTQTNERLITEWLNAQAAGGYVKYAGGKYELPAEHAMA